MNKLNDIDYEFDIPSLRAATGTTHIEAKVLQLLMREEIASHEQLNEINSRIRQIILSLRNKLSPKGITIVNDRDIGYSISLKHKLRLKNIIDGDIMEEMEKAHVLRLMG